MIGGVNKQTIGKQVKMVDDAIFKVAEAKIREAMENGDFANLPGRGKPLNLDDLSGVPEDCRAAYRILKNAGFLPEEMELKKEITSLQKLVECCCEGEEKEKLKAEIAEKFLRYNLLMEKRSR